MLFRDLIAIKRDTGRYNPDQIRRVVSAITDGSASDAQVGAWAMAVILNGLDNDETIALTRAMRDSGDVLTWDLPGPVVDKHSTGGIGDNVSLILAPALAACGVFVPMISGRGLGHTGGTLDKLDAIPGYVTQPDISHFRHVTRAVGCAIIGQTADVAPADKRLYAVRDVTATVESKPLICASILSKKLAAGLDALVLDVKFGSGAFVPTQDDAKILARLLVSVANGAGCTTSAILTDMNEPVASAAGNALETANAIRLLRGDDVDGRLWDVTIALGAELLFRSGAAKSVALGIDKLTEALASGAAAEKFAKMVKALGGPGDILERFESHLPQADIIAEVYASDAGFVSTIDGRALGDVVVNLGGGRRVATDKIDYRVGLDHLAGVGAFADPETPIARVHAASSDGADRAIAAVQSAYGISADVPDPGPLIAESLS